MVRSSYLLTRTRCYMRKAFTMIELIFAIVILAVVMLTIPMMIQVNNKALERSLNRASLQPLLLIQLSFLPLKI